MLSFLEYVNKKDHSLGKKLISNYGHYKAYTVNGDTVRNSSKEAQEFGEYSYHQLIPAVPDKEVWIENNVKPSEREIIIASVLYQLKSIEKGMNPKKAYEEGTKKEKAYRESIESSKKEPWKTNKPARDEIYVKKYGEMDDDGEKVEVWLVDGKKVRDIYGKGNWVEGGHGFCYDFVPNQSIWLENGLDEKELPFILLHEFTERIAMKYRKISYNKAHDMAAKIEWKMRCDTPGSIVEGYSKKKALSLTKEQALKMGEKYLPNYKT